ncbi:MAG: hypothetical protein M4579_005823 [Chaenotheca gracillima]|nr:MAG: hypothetical protein M4579_005823 [Chaenotheca gracillima]
MCVAELRVSVTPCQHRWYQLLRNCQPAHHLSNCPGKLAIQGWEKKCDSCPWCARHEDLSDRDCRLIGSDRTPTRGGLGFLPLQSQFDPRSRARRDSLKSNLSTSSSSSYSYSSAELEDSLMRSSSVRNREQNQRIEAILPTQLVNENNPTPSAMSSAGGSSGDDANTPTSSRSSVSAPSVRFENQGQSSHKLDKVANMAGQGADSLSRGWAKSKRLFR